MTAVVTEAAGHESTQQQKVKGRHTHHVNCADLELETEKLKQMRAAVEEKILSHLVVPRVSFISKVG